MKMTIAELSKELSEMYENAPKGDKVAMIHFAGTTHTNQTT
jgi:hypothetical protein